MEMEIFPILDLPVEIIGCILSFIPAGESAKFHCGKRSATNWLNCICVCKKFYAAGSAAFDPSVYDNFAIQWAAEKGNASVAERLLKDPRVNPATNNNFAIRWASTLGHIQVVKLLLKDPRVDPSAKNNYSIIWASCNGRTEVVQELLKHPKVLPCINALQIALTYATFNNHTQIANDLRNLLV